MGMFNASPRRSNRGVHPKSKRKEQEDDDGGQTRCVCNQQRLGNGEVTPDKYYCDSCRPQNHPYRVQNGTLISNSKRATHVTTDASTLKHKVSKKRHTMNSKDASISINSSTQDWADDRTTPDLTKDSATRSSKRRRRADSISDDNDNDNDTAEGEEDDDYGQHRHTKGSSGSSKGDSQEAHHTSNGHDSNNGNNSNHPTNGNGSNDLQSHSSFNHTSKKSSPHTLKNGHRTSHTPKKSLAKSNIDRQNSSSPSTGFSDSASFLDSEDVHNGYTNSGSKNSRSEELTETDSASAVVPSSKRRKVTKSNAWSSRDDSLPSDDDEYIAGSGNTSKKEHNDSKSKRNGVTSKGTKRHGAGYGAEAQGEGQDNHSNNPSNNSTTARTFSGLSHSSSTGSKKALSRRGQHHRSGSRHSTPAPGGGDGDGTPQPMPAAQPAAVRYPSAKMTLQDMAKRAKQLLDYITRVQIDMIDRKAKMAATRTNRVSAAAPLGDCTTKQTPEPMINQTSSYHNGTPEKDNQVCPNSARSSIDGSTEEPSALSTRAGEEEKSTLTELDSKLLSATTKSLDDTCLEQVTDTKSGTTVTDLCPLGRTIHTATSSLIVKDTLISRGQGPRGEDCNKLTGALSESSGLGTDVVTCLELMNKLSGDLIRFQERFAPSS
ncbi:hypothetical protein BGZ94_008746 [Podila epigama]|nr:hypothetical protein BGZ94_008746 [Podila epigama]